MNESTTADYVAIQQLYSRYCFGLDGNDADLFLSCFVEDGVFAVDDREFVGHDALRPIAEVGGDRPRHHYLNPWIKEVNGDEATGGAYFLTVDLATGENSGYGHYDDHMRRGDDGEWRFVRRHVQFHWQSDVYKARTTKITES
jgi:3-phenylpropionate/cinnamic acid dioxygenase small subunit